MPNLSERWNVALLPGWRARIARAASLAGMTGGEWLRELIRRGIESSERKARRERVAECAGGITVEIEAASGRMQAYVSHEGHWRVLEPPSPEREAVERVLWT